MCHGLHCYMSDKAKHGLLARVLANVATRTVCKRPSLVEAQDVRLHRGAYRVVERRIS